MLKDKSWYKSATVVGGIVYAGVSYAQAQGWLPQGSMEAVASIGEQGGSLGEGAMGLFETANALAILVGLRRAAGA